MNGPGNLGVGLSTNKGEYNRRGECKRSKEGLMVKFARLASVTEKPRLIVTEPPSRIL